MVDAIGHRGPDGQGKQLFEHAAFGHARLAIIDINDGNQPMWSHDQRYCIIFNGEIYNYRQLRATLSKRGHKFHSHSDTEVILELFRAEGLTGLARLRGMYAFALWDKQDQCAILVRDPLGIKPLFLQKSTTGNITFASEAKAIITGQGGHAELDTSNLHLLLNYRYIPGNGSLFTGIEQLAPGQILRWRPNGETSLHTIPLPPSPEENTTLDDLRDSVAAHFTADVEVATYLSGGIDSAAITALGKELCDQPLRTFTLKVGDDPNEAVNAAESARLLGVKNIQGEITDDISRELPRLLWHLETPKINALQVSQLSQLTARHVKVALSGLGGDELFLGYNAHKILSQVERASHLLPPPVARSLGKYGARLLAAWQKPVWSEAERALHMLGNTGNWPRIYGLLRNVWDQPRLRQLIYGPRMLDSILPDAFEDLRRRWPDNPDPVMACAEFEWHNKMVNDLLWQEDRVSMANGLEVRVPFVDGVFAAGIHHLPRKILMAGGQPKAYLRKQLKPLLPEAILQRPKSGFQVSAPEFFRQHLQPLAHQWLSEEKVKDIGLFNPAFIRHVLKQPVRPGLRWHYFILYFMLMTHLWIDIFEKQQWPPPR